MLLLLAAGASLPFAIGVTKAERLLYAPSAGFLAAVAGLLAPLAAGEHTIHIFADFGEIFGTSDVTFYLTVE